MIRVTESAMNPVGLDIDKCGKGKLASRDGHPIIGSYVLVRQVARHLKRDVTPHALET